MSNAIVNISLSAKEDPTVNVTVESSGIISSPSSSSPIISFIPTGESGATGATGLTGSATVPGAINQTHLADDSVGSDEIIDGSITYSKLGVNSVYADKIATNAITTTKLANNSVTNSKLATNSVTADKIAPGTITRELMEIFDDGAIEPDKLKPKSITSAAIQDSSLQASLFIDRSITALKIESHADLDGEVKAHNLKLKGSSPATLTGPDSHALQIKSNATIDFQNTSNTTIASLDQSGNLTLSGTVDGIDIATDVAANSNKTGITTAQADAITANTAKQTNVSTNLSVSPGNNDFIINSSDGTDASLPAVSTTNMGLMTPADKTKLDGMSAGSEVNVNADWNSTSGDSEILNKPSLLQLGTTSTTALAGDTALLQLGTSGTTALAGDTTTISGAQASAITANTAKTGITTSQANAITANTAKPDLTVDGAGTVHANNYTNTTYSEATSSAEGLMSTAHHDKLDGIATGAEVNVQSDWNSSSGDSQILNKPTIPVDLTTDGAGTIHANNVPTLNQDTTGNAATATNLTGGNKALNGTFTSEGLIVDGNVSVTPGDGAAIHVDTADITDNVTSASGTALAYNHVAIENPRVIASNSNVTTINASTLYIKGAPVVGTNMTFTNAYAIYIGGGTSYFAGTIIANTGVTGNLTGNADTATNLVASTSTAVQLGTIELGDASDTTIARTAPGTVTIEGNTIATTNKLIDTKTAGYWSSSTSGFYITLGGSSTAESSSLSTASYTAMYVVPFDGKIKRITSFHQQQTTCTTTLEMYIDGDDSDLTNDQRGSDMTTSAYGRKFTEDCPADWTFSKGEAIAIRRTDTVARYGTTMTIVFEYDTTT